MRAAGESTIMCPSRGLLDTAAKLGQNNTYWYQFVATPIYSINMDDLPYMGAFHGAEVPFVFGDQFEVGGWLWLLLFCVVVVVFGGGCTSIVGSVMV